MIKIEVVGLNLENIKKISRLKNESDYFYNYRLDSYKKFLELKDPDYGVKCDIDYDKIIYYKSVQDDIKDDWSLVDSNIQEEFNTLGVIESEKNLDGIGIQYESEVIYHNMLKELEEKNVIFTSIDEAIKKYPDLVKKYFGKLVSNSDNKFAALNSCVFSGGSFIYIPKNTTLDRPLQSYFRINSKDMGQFERTLIIVDDNSTLHYIEGCTAPTYSSSSLHAAVVEIYVGKNSKCRYSTIQNWAHNVNNLVTKRALLEENAEMEWIDGNIGSMNTMKYPACILKGDNSKGTCITISIASNNQFQDTGSRMIHLGKNTKSKIISKSIALNGGNATYRGKIDIKKSAINSEASLKCDTLILDNLSKSDTYPVNINQNNSSNIYHEAIVSKINEENLLYLMSRGIDREKAIQLIILGFIDKFKQELPVEYAVELNQLIKKNF
ncbi:MAG: Fe-S cluster assembly protein SufB [Bacilli bacterium]|nr:Fe-S cluster assembly protein SufB [Bacilli bacterium]